MAPRRGTRSRSRIAAAAVFGSVVVLVGSGCGSGSGSSITTTGSGNVQTETRDVRGFDSVELAGGGRLVVLQGGTESLQVSADDDVLPNITSGVTGTTLRLGAKPGASIPVNAQITYSVTANSVKRVALSGAGTVTVTGVDGPELSVAHSGAGTITASGRVTRAVLDLTGAGSYNGRDLVSQDVEVSISGTGSAVVDAGATLRARITGVGGVKYLGDPAVTRDGTGIGEVARI